MIFATALSATDYLTLIIITLVAIKLLAVFINPHAWLRAVRRFYASPQLATIVALLLAGIVLYFLLRSGLSIVQILAVSLFVALLMVAGIAPYIEHFLVWIEKQDLKKLLKESWVYSLVWLVLLFWGLVEILQ